MEKEIEIVGRLLPRQYVRQVGALATAAGFDYVDEYVSGIGIVGSAALFAISLAAFIIMALNPIYIILGAIGVVLIVLAAAYQYLLARIDDRRREVDNALPDFLQLAAANVRAGMQLDRALWYAAKPEFGILAKEVELASKRVFSGETIEEALDQLTVRFRSRYLRRTVGLVKEGSASGGEMAKILEQTAIDLRNMQLMQKEIGASMVMYSIFIGFAAAIGAPFLYVVSFKLISLFEKLWTQKTYTGITSPLVQIKPIAPGLTSAEFALFSLSLVIITGVLASVIIAVIQTGRKSSFVRYLLPFVATSMITFYLGRFLIDQLFGSVSL